MPFEGRRIITIGNGGAGIRVDGTSSFRAVSVNSSHNGGHGLDMDEGAEVSVGSGDFSRNGEEGIFQRRTDARIVACAVIDAPSLNDDELFRALQAVHLARDVDRPKVLLEGPLWPSFAKAGLDVIGSIASLYLSLPK